MKILITNDDGIEASGLRLLTKWATRLGEVTVVAPKRGQSAKSHAIEIVHPFEIKKVDYLDGVIAYAVDSTPADCVRFGIVGLHRKYDLVLSGINKGVNIGDDIVYSGTVGAIFEAAKLGTRGIAFSAFPDGQEEASKHLDEVYDYLVENNLLIETPIYNINIPKKAKGIRMTYQGTAYYADGFECVEGDMYRQVGEMIPDERPEDMDRDTVALQNGYITVTPLMESRTDMRVFEKYKCKG